jgi:hypothetical protein
MCPVFGILSSGQAAFEGGKKIIQEFVFFSFFTPKATFNISRASVLFLPSLKKTLMQTLSFQVCHFLGML